MTPHPSLLEKPMQSNVLHVDRALEAAGKHPQNAERRLVWMRHLCLLFWGVALYRGGYEIGVNAVWLTYACGVVYTILLHLRLQDDQHIAATALFTTLADSVLTFLICYVSGGLKSIFVPFFYLTVLSGAFRYGVRETIGMLVLNGSLVALLFALKHGSAANDELLVLPLIYIGISTGLGALLAGWARDNLAIALAQSDVARVERDRSNTLLHRLIDTQEQERKQIASDLHDRMGAHLFALTHGLEQAILIAENDAALRTQLEALRVEACACGSDVRALMNELRPTVLDDLGFFEALGEYLANISDVLPFHLDVYLDPQLRRWRSLKDAMLFRLVQEALLNIRKHAGAQRVKLAFARVDSSVILTVQDNGCGFDTASVSVGHYGLLMMRERAEASGGTLNITSEFRRGTRLTVCLPLEPST